MKRILLIHCRISLLVGFVLLLALCTPALMKRAFPQSPSTNSFAPPADKEQLWHIQI